MSQTVDLPSIGALYKTGLIASFLAFFGILMLIAGTTLLDGGYVEGAIGVLLLGGIWGLIPAVFIAFLITAPLGCAIAFALAKWMEPSQWLGAVTGGGIAAAFLALWEVLNFVSFADLLHLEIVFFSIALVGICAGSGWLAQRKFLDWPRAFTRSDIEAFE